MNNPLDLDRLPVGIVTPPTDEDFVRAERDELELTTDIKEAELQRYLNDTRDRGWLAKWTAYAVSIWLSMVLIILIFNQKYSICLSDTVLATLLGTTTLNVLGLSFIVLKGHFQSSQTTT